MHGDLNGDSRGLFQGIFLEADEGRSSYAGLLLGRDSVGLLLNSDLLETQRKIDLLLYTVLCI